MAWDGPCPTISCDSLDDYCTGDACFGLILLCLTISAHVPLRESDLSSAFPKVSSSSDFPALSSSFATMSAQFPPREMDLLGSFSETSSTTIRETIAGV